MLISPGNASSLCTPIIDAITSEISDLERAFTIIRRQPLPRASQPVPVDDDDDAFAGGGNHAPPDDGVNSLHEALRAREEPELAAAPAGLPPRAGHARRRSAAAVDPLRAAALPVRARAQPAPES